MDSVRQGMREDDIVKGTFDRLKCAECDVTLDTRDHPDDIGSIRSCPECGREWHKLD